MGTAATEGEAVVSGKAGAEGDSEGDDVRNERGDAAVFNGERQYGEMDGGGGGDCLPFILRGIVGWVKGCLPFRPPSSAGRNPQRAGSVRSQLCSPTRRLGKPNPVIMRFAVWIPPSVQGLRDSPASARSKSAAVCAYTHLSPL